MDKEADGRIFVKSLPTEGSEHPAFAKMGITFGEVDINNAFRPVNLPDGWYVKVAPGCSGGRYSCLFDSKDRRRATILVKPDSIVHSELNASMYPCGRFAVGIGEESGSGLVLYNILDNAALTKGYYAATIHQAELIDCDKWIRENGGDPEDPSVGWD